jgi:conjugal transfer pilus assembly protein TraK
MSTPARSKHLQLAALCLAISGVVQAQAQEEIKIPGMNMPIAISTQPAEAQAEDQPQAEKPKAKVIGQLNLGQQPAPSSAPKKRLVLVENPGNEIPAVPADVMRKRPQAQAQAAVETRQDVVVSSGTNTLIPISRSQINRLVTPFDNPNIQTVSSAEISTSGNVIYVTTEDDQPVTMFVTPEDDESVAISLTLLPQKIPPIQANLIFGNSVQGMTPGAAQGPSYSGSAYSGTARKWERSQPYMDTIRSLMREMAMGRLPRGYSFGALQSGDSIPACAQPELNFDFSKSQLIQGHDFRVYVAVAENTSAKTVELYHGACSHPHRVAASSWPHEILEPGQKTEVFVVTRIPKTTANTSVRPSLLN